MLLTGTTVVISTFKRWSSISTQSAATTWTKGKSERYFPKLMSPETEPSTSGSLKFVSWTFVSQLTFWPSVSHESDKECWLEKGSKKTQQKWKHFHQNQWPQVPEYFISFIAPSKLQELSTNFREIQFFGEGCYLGHHNSESLCTGVCEWSYVKYCENFVKFCLQLYKLPGICRRVFDLCDKDSNGTLSFRVTSTCYVNYAISSQPHCLQLTLCWSRRRGKGANSSKIASESRR